LKSGAFFRNARLIALSSALTLSMASCVRTPSLARHPQTLTREHALGDTSVPGVMHHAATSANEHDLPTRVVLTINIPGTALGKAHVVELPFVLVSPDTSIFEGVKLSVEHSFYMLESELTNAQLFAIYYSMPLRSTAESFEDAVARRVDEVITACANCDLSNAEREEMSKHFEQPHLPALACTTSHVDAITWRLSALSGVEFRVPTFSEWLCAADAEAPEGVADDVWSALQSRRVIWRGYDFQKPTLAAFTDATENRRNAKGVADLFGSAREFVRVTKHESESLNAILAQQHRDWRSRFSGGVLTPSQTLLVGGSVANIGAGIATEHFARDQFVSSVVDWRQVFTKRPFEQPLWMRDANWASGIRLAVDAEEIRRLCASNSTIVKCTEK
jgi:hypothetical protein